MFPVFRSRVSAPPTVRESRHAKVGEMSTSLGSKGNRGSGVALAMRHRQ